MSDKNVAMLAQANAAGIKAHSKGLNPDDIEIDVVATIIYNHGVAEAMKFFELPKPNIRSIFYRTDCWARCQLAAEQMIQKSKGD
jgi:hypothetical protein